MGKANRQRRAAKARKRPRAGRPARGPDVAWSPSEEPLLLTAGERFMAAVWAEQRSDAMSARRVVEVLAAGAQGLVASEISALLEDRVGTVWSHGWQPSDLDRSVRRECAKSERTLLRWVVAAEGSAREGLGARVAPDWMAQLRNIKATRTWDPRRPYLTQIGEAWPEALHAAVRLMCFLYRLPRLARLVAPPSEWREGAPISEASLPSAMLHRVRALLAKAESTSFDAEAEAFTAKAQELMARHRIDRAVLDASGQERQADPTGRRIGLDDPYADAKAVLLGVVAAANGCRAVWSKDMGFSTVFGFADELGAVDELFTSLLVQANAALQREGSKQDRFGRSRTTRFRRSFLLAFAARIGQRLHDSVNTTVEQVGAETGTALVPILAAREDASRAAAEAAFPEAHTFSPSATDGEGWFLGTLFGDQADVGVGPELSRRSA